VRAGIEKGKDTIGLLQDLGQVVAGATLAGGWRRKQSLNDYDYLQSNRRPAYPML